MSLQVTVPEDHGAVDIVRQEAGWVEVAPRDYPGDTYPNLWYYFSVKNGPHPLPQARVTLSDLFAGQDRVYVPFFSASLWSRDGGKSWQRVPPRQQKVSDDRVEFRFDLAGGEEVWFAETFPIPWAQCEAAMGKVPEINQPGFRCESWRVGDSEQGRPIIAARLGSGQGRPVMLWLAGQHAVEESGKLCCLTILEWLLANRRRDEVRDVLSRWEVVICPMVNPDGCVAGRMNTNAKGVVMNSPDDRSAEMRAQIGLVDEVRPKVLIDCHGWGNTIGTPPFDGWYRWEGDDPLYDHVVATVPGAATSTEHLMGDLFRLEPYARERYGTHSGMLEINWNYRVRPDGAVARPTLEDLQERSLEYFRAVAGWEP